jgi:hypothetical protein
MSQHFRMPFGMRFRIPGRAAAAVAATAGLSVTPAACASGSGTGSGHSPGMPGMDHSGKASHSPPADDMASMPGMGSASTGNGDANGVTAAQDGYRMTSAAVGLPAGTTVW